MKSNEKGDWACSPIFSISEYILLVTVRGAC